MCSCTTCNSREEEILMIVANDTDVLAIAVSTCQLYYIILAYNSCGFSSAKDEIEDGFQYML
jgi:hypothetical protein